jgi:hypothetical protein
MTTKPACSIKSVLKNVAVASVAAGACYTAIAIIPNKLTHPKVFANGRYLVISYPGGALGHIHHVLFSDDGKRFTFEENLGHDHGSGTDLILDDYAVSVFKTPQIEETIRQGGHKHRFSVIGPF